MDVRLLYLSVKIPAAEVVGKSVLRHGVVGQLDMKTRERERERKRERERERKREKERERDRKREK